MRALRTALVIGASGLVGGALVRALERSGVEVTATGHSRAAGMSALDVREAAAVEQCVAAAKPDVIFLAVNVPGGVDRCEEQPDAADAVNVQGTKHVAAAAAQHGATLVYYSTDYVFDGKSGPYAEEDPPNPISVYGRTKLEAEQIVRERVPRHLIVRTTAVYGWDRGSRNFAMQVWERLGGGQPLRVPHDQLCNPTLAEYLAETSLRLVQEGVEGVVNVVGRDRMSRADLARQLARAMALDPALVTAVPTSELSQKAPRPLAGGLKIDKLARLLGTEPLDLAESLKRFRRGWRADTHTSGAPTAGARAAAGEAEQLKQEILEKVRRYWEVAHQPQLFVPRKSRVNYAGRVYGPEELVNLVDASLDFWLTLGPWGDLFEAKLRKYLGCRDVVLVNSGSTANLTAVMALMSPLLDNPLRPGDEVITPAVTFPSTLAPLVHGGLVPVFVDCEVGTYNVNPRLLAGAIGPKTRALVLPHTLGNPFDLDVVMDLVKRHTLYLIEDTCDALGGTWRGKPVGTFGDLATLSFFPAHHITMGEGGAVVVNNPRLATIVRSVRDWGRACWCAPGESNTCGKRFGWELGELPRGYDHKYIYSTLGYNFKPTDLQAAIGVAQLDRLAGFVAKRREHFVRLSVALAPFRDRLVLPTEDPRAQPSWFGFPITVREGVSRAALVQALETANIETRQVFGGNILKQPGYRDITRRVHGTLAETDRIMRDTFFIGVYPGLTDGMLEFVARAFGEFFSRR
ncbi:MAG: lipopolysaccharide biosynthesis protein RfbH [Candidatus Rokubacteria bacterium]|nr:lipopolysaccharide biosynthesis protein RfbH [Candidatus Rokubacteria bacterium]